MAGGSTLLAGLQAVRILPSNPAVVKGTAHHKLGEAVDVKLYSFGDLAVHESVKVLDIKQVPPTSDIETQSFVLDIEITNLLNSAGEVFAAGDFSMIDATSQANMPDFNPSDSVKTDLPPHTPKTITLTFSQVAVDTPPPGNHPYILNYIPDEKSL